MDLSYANVFKPGTYPNVTYVTRQSEGTKYTYEERLKQSLSIDGFLTYIVGPSKIGKTVLCERVIGQDNIISMTGNDFSKETDFWTGIKKKIGISTDAEVSESSSNMSSGEKRSTVVTKKYLSNKDKVLDFFKKHKKILLLDDFHYAPEQIQYDISCQLKEVIRLGFKAVVISLPHRSDDAIRLNPDLAGRISVIEMKPWKTGELQEIALKGFAQLNIQVRDSLISRMAIESIHSPQLMQSICLNIGLLPEEYPQITDEAIEESCRFTCVNLPYADVVRVLKAGPPTRGQQRLKYQLKDGSQRDIYDLMLKILSKNPPLIELGLNELIQRIQENLTEKKITPKKIRDSLKNWQKLLESQDNFYQVFEWKDDIIYVLDNLFLFYIRWMSE